MNTATFYERLNALAAERAGNLPTWTPFNYERLDSGMKVTGCLTTRYTRGPRKGQFRFLRNATRKTVVLSEDDIRSILDATATR